MQAERHAHNHATHDHAAHDHPAEARKNVAFSLLRMSAAHRMAIVLAALAAIWGGVRWALS